MSGGKDGKSEVETELKIKLSRSDLENVFKILLKDKDAGRLEHKFLPRAYYDTDDLDFHKAGISLRVQYNAGKGKKIGCYRQTFKFEMKQDGTLEQGTFLRTECKNNLESPKPDVTIIADPDAQLKLKPFKNKKLSHIFTASIERRYFTLPVWEGKNKAVVELAFDVGDIILQPDGENFPISEIEIEVKSGNPSAIETLKNEILQLAPSAQVQPYSKAQTGTQLYAKAWGKKI